jgi:hypothetical protein
MPGYKMMQYNMNTMLPTSDAFVEQVAKALGRERLYRDASDLLESTMGIKLHETDSLDARFDREFEMLWASNDEEAIWNRESYKADALVAINKINLLLLTMTP